MKVLVFSTIVIIFISVIVGLSVINNIVEKYSKCKEHMFSESPQCNMVELGQSLSTGMTILGLLFIVSTGSAYLLINSAFRETKRQYSYFS